MEKSNNFASEGRPGNRLARLGIHGALLATFVTGGISLLVWPQWLTRDNSQIALAAQLSRERELETRLEGVQAPAQWAKASETTRPELWRKALTAGDLERFPSRVQSLANAEGVKVAHVSFTPEVTPRWRAVTQRAFLLGAPKAGAGAVRPMVATVILTGSFEGLYRTVTRLCEREQLFIPDRWNFVPRDGSGSPPNEYKAEVAATVFVMGKPAQTPIASARTGVLALRGGTPREVTE